MITNIKPTFMADSLESLDVEQFIARIKALGIQGVTYDLDDTLTGHYHDSVTDKVLAVIQAVYDSGIEQQGVVSNAGAESRSKRVYKIADSINKVTGKNLIVVTSHEHDSRKPATKLYEVAAAALSLDHNQICHVGDQLLKDVLGANRAGYRASLLLVEPIGECGNWFVQHIQRPIEKLIIPRLRKVISLNKQ